MTFSPTLPNNSFIRSRDYVHEKIQDPEKILKVVRTILGRFQKKHKAVSGSSLAGIGLTGQMHGIIYVDRQGEAVSPLYTWQDSRAGKIFKNGKTYCDEMLKRTGYTIFSGYGLATHFYNIQKQLVPKGAVKLCTIHDLVAMKLAENNVPSLTLRMQRAWVYLI